MPRWSNLQDSIRTMCDAKMQGCHRRQQTDMCQGPKWYEKNFNLIIGVGEGRQSLRTGEEKGGEGREREGTGGGENLLSDNNVKFCLIAMEMFSVRVPMIVGEQIGSRI